MKFCPYCGAALVGGAASFCPECGESLPSSKPYNYSHDTAFAQPDQEDEDIRAQYADMAISAKGRKQGMPHKPGRKPQKGRRRPSKKIAQPATEPEIDPQDVGYDGYYNDVSPLDNGYVRDRMDPELIKRVVYIAGGALVIIILSVILMYLL